MNKSFKVVFNKARGALMVVNEATSCIQAKGTKTVIAAAVAALVSAGVEAATAPEAPEGINVNGQYIKDHNNTLKFQHADGKVANIKLHADARKVADAVEKLAKKQISFEEFRAAISQADLGKDQGVLVGFAGGGNFMDGTSHFELGVASGIIHDELAKRVIKVLKDQFGGITNKKKLEGNTLIIVGEVPGKTAPISPVMIGTVGADNVLNLGLGGLSTVVDVTRKGNSSITVNSGNLFGTVVGSSAVNVGKGISIKKGLTIETGAKETHVTLDGNTTALIQGTGCVAGLVGGSSAIAIGGKSTATVTGSTTIIVNNADQKNDGTGIDTASIGLIGGGFAASAMGGDSLTTVKGDTFIDLKSGLVAGVVGGGVAVTGDIHEIAALPQLKDHNITIDETLSKNPGKATAESQNVAINVGSDVAAFGIVGGGVALGYQFGDSVASAQSTSKVKTVAITLGEDEKAGSYLTGEKKSILVNAIKNKNFKGLDDIRGVTVGLVGGGISAAYDGDVGQKNGEHTAQVSTSVETVGLAVKSGYNVALVGGGLALGSGHSKTGKDVLAQSQVNDVIMNFTGGETIGVMGGGASLWTGSREAHEGVGAKANVDNVQIAVTNEDADVEGIFAGGWAIDDSNPFVEQSYKKVKNAEANVNSAVIAVKDGFVGRLNVKSFNEVTGIPGKGQGKPEIVNGYLKSVVRSIQDANVAILGGGIASGMRADGAIKEVAGASVNKSEIVLVGGTVGNAEKLHSDNIYGGGIATEGAATYVNTSNIVVDGAKVYGDIYGGGIAMGGLYRQNDYNNALSYVENSRIQITTGEVYGDIYAGGKEFNFDNSTKGIPNNKAKATVENSTIVVDPNVFKGENGNKIVGEGAKQSHLTFIGESKNCEGNVTVSGFDILDSLGTTNVSGLKYDFAGKDLITSGNIGVVGLSNADGRSVTINDGHFAVKDGYKDATFTVNSGALILGTSDVASVAEDLAAYDGSALYLTGKVDLTGMGITVGDFATPLSSVREVKIGHDSYLMVDASATSQTEVTGEVKFAQDAAGLHFVHVAEGASEGVNLPKLDGLTEDKITVDNVAYDVTIDKDGHVIVKLVTDEEELHHRGLQGFAPAAIASIAKQDDEASKFFNSLLDEKVISDARVRNAKAKSATNVAVAAGLQTASIEASLMGMDLVAANASINTEAKEGFTTFAKVSGSQFEFGGSESALETKTTLGGVFFGVQHTGGSFTVGVAGHIGMADAKGQGYNDGVDNDIEFYGANAYAAYRFNNFNVLGQVGYMLTKNDITEAHGNNASVDADVYTAGIKGEASFEVTKSFKATPYVAANYVRVGADGYQTAKGIIVESQDQNLVSVPVGVVLSGNIDTASGWSVTPSLDVAYVHTFGDTDLTYNDTKIGKTNIGTSLDVWTENAGRAKLGLTATNGAFGLGLSLGGAAGNNDYKALFGEVNVKYAF